MGMVAALVVLHDLVALDRFPAAACAWFAAASLIYALGSAALLRRYFSRVSRVDLGFVFLAVDPLVWAAAIWISGGSRSWLYFLLFVRVADQANTTFRRVLFFAHEAVLCY